ncbi:MAG: hypothetical protein M1819_004168 [Sarea resinae]|nr:MAG: hypothetical protein M1819_004168 [Sarea resinae]
MVYSLAYRRPPHVNSSDSSVSGNKVGSIGESYRSGSSSLSYGIPEALAFDRIISGGTCPPCTVRDFMNYLIYIEHAAENLQFFLWHRDYTKRFANLPEKELSLSPEWTIAQVDAENLAAQTNTKGRKKVSPAIAAVIKGTAFAPGSKVSVAENGSNPFITPPRTPAGTLTPSVRSASQDIGKKAAGAFESADQKWQPFTVQPYREELSRVIATYVADGAPRQLNLSSRERTALLHALQNTTHPSALAGVIKTVEWSLRRQAHPNFVRWSICNGNRPRVIFARGLGIGLIVVGLLVSILITLSGASRGYRALAAIAFVLGIATLIAAWKGMCVVLHGMHHRHLRPWELFTEDDDESSSYEMHKGAFDSFGSGNSYEDEPWVAKYEKRNVIRKVLDREVWIQEPALRQIQDTIFLQAMGASIILSAILTAIFVAVPRGRFY